MWLAGGAAVVAACAVWVADHMAGTANGAVPPSAAGCEVAQPDRVSTASTFNTATTDAESGGVNRGASLGCTDWQAD